MAARLYRAVFALVAWFALGLQYRLTISGNPHMGAGELTLNFFSYFTILSNILVALALTAPVVAPNSRIGRWALSEGVRAAVAMFIVVVGVVYHFLLAGIWAPQGWALVGNVLLHYVMPAAFVIDWLAFTPKGRLRWVDPAKWLVPVLIYGGWTLLHGKLSGWWPYWFTDVDKLGLGKVMVYFAGLLVFFLVVGLIVVAIDRTFGRRDSQAIAA
ncbi:Pr6Pr family membrane protein [Brevundimonas faecalis]|uniref:Pr6Pr family membrane protein n=1 Tax=Brevundimonas faecalis TaxID=947378 RepID=A0ABV2RFD0_9CAUL